MGGFLTHGGGPTHGLCQEGWETDFPPTGGFLTHGGISHPWGDFSPMGGFLTHGGATHGGCLLWSVRPVVAALSVPAIASVSAAAGAAVAESAESTVAVDDA